MTTPNEKTSEALVARPCEMTCIGQGQGAACIQTSLDEESHKALHASLRETHHLWANSCEAMCTPLHNLTSYLSVDKSFQIKSGYVICLTLLEM